MLNDSEDNQSRNEKEFLTLKKSKWLCHLFLCLVLTIVIAFLIKTQSFDSKQQQKVNTITDDDISSLSLIMKKGEEDKGFPLDFFPVDSGEENMYWPIIPDEHWNFMPHPYEPWNSSTSWCQDESAFDTKTPAGLIYVKVHKAASSTLAGVNLRIAINYGKRHLFQTKRRLASYPRRGLAKKYIQGTCYSHENHDDSRIFFRRDPSRSFMYASIRHPVHRAMSWFYYLCSNQGFTVTDEFAIERFQGQVHFVKGKASKSSRFFKEAGAQAGYLYTGKHARKYLWSADEPGKVTDLRTSIARVATIMKEYDLIMIVERMDESLVVLQLLLQLETSDILYLSAKQSGGYSYSAAPFEGCHKIMPSKITPALNEFFSSPFWYAQNYEDYILYNAANRSLDLTIEKIGRNRFDAALSAYRKMMNEVKVCANETIQPCSSNGTHNKDTDCYYRDWGCGYPCMDRLTQKTNKI
jgi:Galactose-3-O-sulfotransferase